MLLLHVEGRQEMRGGLHVEKKSDCSENTPDFITLGLRDIHFLLLLLWWNAALQSMRWRPIWLWVRCACIDYSTSIAAASKSVRCIRIVHFDASTVVG